MSDKKTAPKNNPSPEKQMPGKVVSMEAHKCTAEFCKAKPALLEQAESLEQLRALYMGAKIKVIKVEKAFPGVDTPEDLEKISKIISTGNK